MLKKLLLMACQQFWANRSRWSLWFPVAFATGIGIYFALPFEPSKWVSLGLIEALILAAILGRFHRRFLAALIIPAIIVAGFAYIQIRTIYESRLHFPAPTEKLYLTGRVVKTDYNRKGNLRLHLDRLHDYDGNPVPGKFRVALRYQDLTPLPGQCVELVAKLMPLPRAVLPGGYQFDRKTYFEGFSGSGYALSRALPVDCTLGEAAARPTNYWVNQIRSRILSKIKTVLPPAQASVAAAIIAGEQGRIKTGLINNYRDSGLAHFLSISGLHMSMIAGLMFFLIRLIMALIPPLALRYDSKKTAAWFAIFISIVYLLISGAAIPAQRAFIMTFIVLLGILTNRRAVSMKTIAWAAFIVLLVSPQALIGASFQMSFAAVTALIAFYEHFASRLSRFFAGTGDRLDSLGRKVLKVLVIYFIGIILTDLIASLATLPFAVYHFNRIAVYTSLANFAAGPIIGFIIMPFTLLSLLLMPLGLDYWSLQITGFGIGLVNNITGWVSSLPGAGFQLLSMPLWGFLMIIFGSLWLMIWITRWRWLGLISILIGFGSIITVTRPDLLVNDSAEVFAVKDNDGQLLLLPSRGNNFVKTVWREKMAMKALSSAQKSLLSRIYKGKLKHSAWLDLTCDQDSCLYCQRIRLYKSGGIDIDGKNLDMTGREGVAIYLHQDKVKIISVRDTIGRRLWNNI